MASKRVGIEQPILVEFNKVVYSLKSLSFYLEWDANLGKEIYRELFSGLILSPEELEVLTTEVENSNLRFMKPIRYFSNDSPLPFVVML